MSSILVIEQEGLITRLLNEALGSNEGRVVMILNGNDAVRFALHEMPSLVILNVAQPGLESYSVIRRLREHPKSMHIPIIVVSNSGSTMDKVRAFDLGIDCFIEKPADKEALCRELVAVVRSHLRRTQQCSLSPLTLLPGGLQLERAIDNTLNSPNPWGILYLDLDNFKAFNDVYGFLAGNNMILLVGHICQQAVYDYGNVDDFVGHVGGDDFVIVTTPDCVHTLCHNILARYKKESSVLYQQEDLERGSISGTDRKGRPYQFPLVSLSIGVVSSQARRLHSLDEIGSLVADAKRHAKQSTNNLYYSSLQCNKSNHTLPSSPHTASFRLTSYFERHLFQVSEEEAVAEFK